METQPPTGHSALVTMTLIIGDKSVRVGQMGPNFLILSEPFSTEAPTATLRLTIDGTTEHIPVRLPNGIQAESSWVEIVEMP